MTLLLARAVCLVALLGAPAAFAQSNPVREMMQASGMTEQFGDMGDEFRTGVVETATEQGAPKEMAEAMGEIAGRTFDGKRFLTDIEAELTETLSSDEIAAIKQFYGSPAGKRLKDAEVAASTTEVRNEISAHQAELRANLEKQPDRLAVLTRMDDAMLGTELTASVVENMISAVMIGTMEGQEQPVGKDALAIVERRAASMREMLLPELRREVRASFARTYRDIPLEDLKIYADFLETERAKAVYAALFAATDDIFSARSREFGRAFAEMMREKRT